MPERRDWTATADNTIRTMRAEGATWGAIGSALGLSRNTIIERGRRIRAMGGPVAQKKQPREPDDALNRAPLHAGHPIAWAVLTAGTILEGTLFVPLGADRQEFRR